MSAVDADAAAAVSTGGDNASTHDAGESSGDDSVDVYWGDEIISKTGQLKAVLPKLTAKASVAIATRSSGAVLLFKDVQLDLGAFENVSVYVSWEKPKKRVRYRSFLAIAQCPAPLFAPPSAELNKCGRSLARRWLAWQQRPQSLEKR